jgi:hypothetical protein
MTNRPTLTKQHFIAIAEILFRYRDETPTGLVDAFANMGAEANPAFDRERFILACTTGKVSARKGCTPR